MVDFANCGVDDGIDLCPREASCFGNDLDVRERLAQGNSSRYFGDDGVVIVGVKPSTIADLAARFGIEWRVIENDFADALRALVPARLGCP